ncbi:hypothetical protein O9992_00705 [Vibrio lentus]|nr:hypothetical protein [Vibrio lentus]
MEVGSQRCFNEDEQQCLMPQRLGFGANSDNFGSRVFTRQRLHLTFCCMPRRIKSINSLNLICQRTRGRHVSMEKLATKKYMDLGDVEKAEQYRLLDLERINVTTVQFYDKSRNFINPCLGESST